MTVFVPNTTINNTWDFWRNRTNELATAMSNQVVTVGGNTTFGNAVIQGSLRANTLYFDVLSGGNSSVASNLTVTTGTTFSSDVVFQTQITVKTGITANTLIANSLVKVGNTSINTTSITTNTINATFVGSTIGIQYGGTGRNTLPANGQLLIGNGTAYTLSTLTPGTGVEIINNAGAITINSTGVTWFQSNTSNGRSGIVNLTSQDVIQALGYIPSAPASSSWLFNANDLFYFNGNVSVGVVLTGNNTIPNKFYVKSNTNDSTPIAVFNNSNTGPLSSGTIAITSANATADVGVVFPSSGNVRGGVTYNITSGVMALTTNGNNYVNINGSGNIGVGTDSPSPLEGGQGIHIVGPSPGITFDQSGVTRWHIGQNPSFDALSGGARVFGPFGFYSDEAKAGLLFDSNTSAGMAVYTNNIKAMYISNTGIIQIGTNSTSGKLNVGGDVNAEGFVNYSDYRVKNNIIPLSNAIERVMALNPVSFMYNGTMKIREGFIAHEVQEVIPSAVKGVKDAFAIQTLDKTEMVAVTVKALQELINKVNQLEEKLSGLTPNA